ERMSSAFSESCSRRAITTIYSIQSEKSMSPQTDFPLVFEQLRSILKPYSKNLTITADTATGYSLDGPYSEKYKKVVFFGAAQIQKNYVSFYLMSVYMFPEILKDI